MLSIFSTRCKKLTYLGWHRQEDSPITITKTITNIKNTFCRIVGVPPNMRAISPSLGFCFVPSLSIQKQFRYFGLLFNPFSNSSIVGIDDLKSFGKSSDIWYSEITIGSLYDSKAYFALMLQSYIKNRIIRQFYFKRYIFSCNDICPVSKAKARQKAIKNRITALL